MVRPCRHAAVTGGVVGRHVFDRSSVPTPSLPGDHAGKAGEGLDAYRLKAARPPLDLAYPARVGGRTDERLALGDGLGDGRRERGLAQVFRVGRAGARASQAVEVTGDHEVTGR
jgi:hypothetical protein